MDILHIIRSTRVHAYYMQWKKDSYFRFTVIRSANAGCQPHAKINKNGFSPTDSWLVNAIALYVRNIRVLCPF